MTAAKITLSAKELELVCNTDWILTKHAIIQKVYVMFGDLLPQMEAQLNDRQALLPEVIFLHSPKIARGENYRQLPYVIADYPRIFSKSDTLAIRTLFWWGNFFSISLHVSGKYQPQVAAALLKQWSSLQQSDYWIAIGESPWEHHFEPDNVKKLSEYSREQFGDLLEQMPFIKIVKKTSLQQWNDTQELTMASFREMTGWLTA